MSLFIHNFNRLFGKVMIGLSLLICTICFFSLGKEGTIGTLGLIGFTLGVVGLLMGALLWWTSGKKARLQLTTDREKMLLNIIKQHGGKVTPAEIATSSDLSIVESQEALDELCRAGAGELEIIDGGKLVYVFHGFLSAEEKSKSRNVLD